MAKPLRFELHMGTLYFLELTHQLQLTTRNSITYSDADKKLIQLAVTPDYSKKDPAGGTFYVTVMYPESTNMGVQHFPMTTLKQNEDGRYVYALVPVDIGPCFVTFQIEAKATF
jgi:hypothetical protein